VVADPFGHRWALSTACEQLTLDDIARLVRPCNSSHALQQDCLCEVKDAHRVPALESIRGGSRSGLYPRR
jgi:hypothetical protein